MIGTEPGTGLAPPSGRRSRTGVRSSCGIAAPLPEARFCPTCGSTVWWESLRVTDRVAVATGVVAGLTLNVVATLALQVTLGLGRTAPWIARYLAGVCGDEAFVEVRI